MARPNLGLDAVAVLHSVHVGGEHDGAGARPLEDAGDVAGVAADLAAGVVHRHGEAEVFELLRHGVGNAALVSEAAVDFDELQELVDYSVGHFHLSFFQ